MSRHPRRLVLLLAAAVFLLALHAVLLGGAAPVVRTLAVRLPGPPAGRRPLRLVLISDLHVARPGDTPARLRDTVARIDALRPDIVLIAGDVVASGALMAPTPLRDILPPLSGLHAPLGIVAVLGNHDYPMGERLPAQLRALGIAVLRNDVRRVGPFAILGIGDAFSRHDDVARTMARWRALGGTPIVLTHSPDVIPRLPAALHLVLAGHTHCGQVRLPILGAPSTASRYGQRYGCGVVRDGARISVISAGLGMSNLPIRIGAAPDLWLITVR